MFLIPNKINISNIFSVKLKYIMVRIVLIIVDVYFLYKLICFLFYVK